MLTIRKARAGDTSSIIDLINQLEDSYNFQITPKENNLAKFQHYIQSEQYIVFIAVDELNELQGIITLAPILAFYAQGEMGIIHEFYVTEAYRSKGIAAQLMDCAKQYAEDKKWMLLELSMPRHDNNKLAYNFYHKAGFIDFGVHMIYETSHAAEA